MRTLRGSLVTLLLLAGMAGAQDPGDADHDGLADALEIELLEQFRPTFMVSGDDCDGLPARMAPGEGAARVVERDGTVYGQATPHAAGGVELRYFHLWARDCGRNGHEGDIEHVSGLLSQDADGTWRARYWYAAAHQGTVCDRCMAVRAQPVGTSLAGPTVWISAGKHASYLAQDLCNGGCGGDTCLSMRPAPALPIVNLGETTAPMNGAVWATSAPWPLGIGRRSDFEPELVAQLDAAQSEAPVRVNSNTPGMQRTVSVSNTTLGGLETAGEHTDSALGTAKRSTGNALQRSYRAVKGWLGGKQ
jgi:hypothetical protein